nr:sigma-70 family RNA polymerase sigma factor [candidate division Zixibacteria bacterium]
MPEKTGEEKQPLPVNSQDDTAEDRQWVLAAQSGDKNAYGKLVTKYQRRLFRFLFMMLKEKEMAGDIVQDAFVRGYAALDAFEVEKPFYPWIATIARNLAINLLKKEERERPISEYENLMETTPDSSDNPLDLIIEKETEDRFGAAVAALPTPYRTVFVLRMFEKLSYEEIARQLNISPGTVDSRLHRARQKLVEMLKDYL